MYKRTKLLLKAKLLFIYIFLTIFGYSQSITPNSNYWIPNGPVNKLVLNGDYVYMGGSFTSVFPKERYVGGGAIFDTLQYVHNTKLKFVDGSVSSIISDGQGGWFVGGTFKSIGDSLRNNIARINADGTVHPWNPNSNGVVNTIVKVGHALYVLGNFSKIGAQTLSKIAKLSDTTNVADSLFKPTSNNTITTIAANDTAVYIGGWFTAVNNLAISKIAKISAIDGSLDTKWNPNYIGTYVSQILLENDDLYVAGWISTINTKSLGNLVKLSAKTALADDTWLPNVGIYATSIAIDNEFIYVCGNFKTVSGKAFPYAARIFKSNGTLDESWQLQANGDVSSFAFTNKYVFVTGAFTQLGNDKVSFMACVDKNTALVNQKWTPQMDNSVNSVFAQGSNVFVGGSFKGYNGFNCGSIVRLNKTGEPDQKWSPKATGLVTNIEFWKNRVIFSGSFSKVNDVIQNNISKVDTSTGAVDAWRPLFNFSINTILVAGDNLYVGGPFSNISPYNRGFIAKFNLNSGAFNSTWNPNANGTVNNLVLYKNALFVGGSFTSMGGNTSKAYFCKIDTAGTGLVDGTFSETVDKDVNLIQIRDTVLYLFGSFTKTGSYWANNYSVLNLKTKKFYWKPIVISNVNTQLYNGEYVYFGGSFTMSELTILNKTVINLSRFPIQTNSYIDSTWCPNPNGAVYSITTDGSNLFIGGAFSEISKTKNPYFSVFTLLPNTYTPTTNKNWNNPNNWSYQRPPNANEDVVLNNDTIFVTNPPSSPAVCKRLTINTNATLVVNPGGALTSGISILQNTQSFYTTRNNGSILIKTDSLNNIGSFNPGDSLIGNGTFKSEYYFSKNTDSKGNIEPIFFTIPIETEVSSMYNPSVNKLMRYDSDLQTYVQITTNDYVLKPGVGYKIQPAQSFKITHWGTKFITTPYVYDLKSTYTKNINNGFYLVGNPLTCSYDWQKFDYSFNLYDTYWIEKRNANNKKVFELYNKNIRINTQNSSDTLQANTIIVPNQAFFVKSYSNPIYKTSIANSSCTHLKYNSPVPNQLYTEEMLKFKLYDDKNNSDESIVINDRYVYQMGYPSCPKLFSDELSQCYLVVDTNRYTLLLKPYYTKKAQIGVKSISKGIHSFVFTNGNSFIGQSVYFEDLKMGKWFSLKSDTTYSFELDTGFVNNRFFLHFGSFNTPGLLNKDTIIAKGDSATLSLIGSRGNITWQESLDGLNTWSSLQSGTLTNNSLVYNTGKLFINKYFRTYVVDSIIPTDTTFSNIVKVTVLTTTNIQKLDNEGLYISPNPFKGVIRIQSNYSNVKHVVVISSQGLEVLNKEMNQDESTIDLTNISPGIYFIKIETENNSYVRRIIKSL